MQPERVSEVGGVDGAGHEHCRFQPRPHEGRRDGRCGGRLPVTTRGPGFLTHFKNAVMRTRRAEIHHVLEGGCDFFRLGETSVESTDRPSSAALCNTSVRILCIKHAHTHRQTRTLLKIADYIKCKGLDSLEEQAVHGRPWLETCAKSVR